MVYLLSGLIAVALGAIGAFLPILPTVPFLLLATFCFARSNPAWERRMIEHPRFGPSIMAWRERRAIGRRAKMSALLALAASAAAGLLTLASPWCYIPLAVALMSGSWIATRAE